MYTLPKDESWSNEDRRSGPGLICALYLHRCCAMPSFILAVVCPAYPASCRCTVSFVVSIFLAGVRLGDCMDTHASRLVGARDRRWLPCNCTVSSATLNRLFPRAAALLGTRQSKRCCASQLMPTYNHIVNLRRKIHAIINWP